jgi:hypothetical protein
MVLLVGMSLGCSLMTSARADIFNLTPLDMYPGSVPGVQTKFLDRTFTTGDTAFDDLWTFDVSGPDAQAAISLSALSTTLAGLTANQSPLKLQLFLQAWDGNGYGITLDASNAELAPVVQAPLAQSSGGAPGHGFYALQVLGTTPVNAVLTQYSGQLQVVAVPQPPSLPLAVPEPSMLMLAVGGLLFVVSQVRRHARQQ